jgi:NADH:ubiquinone oxidoreductase subunit K
VTQYTENRTGFRDRLSVPRLFFVALALVAVTLLAVNQTLTAGAVDAQVRLPVLAIACGAAVLALGIAFLVTRSRKHLNYSLERPPGFSPEKMAAHSGSSKPPQDAGVVSPLDETRN